jgi:hypothetical protein
MNEWMNDVVVFMVTNLKLEAAHCFETFVTTHKLQGVIAHNAVVCKIVNLN